MTNPRDQTSKVIHYCPNLLDLLVEMFEPECGLERQAGTFSVSRPWALAHFGSFSLGKGWWTFECEGEGDVGAVELRLVSPEDALLVFSLRRSANVRVYFHAATAFDVSALLSAWPGNVRLSRLRLRRLSLIEQASIAGDMTSRLFRSPKPLSRLFHVVSRVMGGRSLRLQPVGEIAPTPPPRTTLARATEADFHAIREGDITAVLRIDERLHARAFEIVSSAFTAAPHQLALYSDLDEGGHIVPRPAWDADLAAQTPYAASPVFIRGAASPLGVWQQLRQLPPGAVGRIPLPLAARAQPFASRFDPPPILQEDPPPRVSIIIPTKIRLDLLQLCLAGLSECTDYPHFDVVIVNNGADAGHLDSIIAGVSDRIFVRKVDDFGDFNFSRLVNVGVRASHGEIVLLLNDDIEPIAPDWLTRIVSSAMAFGVGCVGARLLYPDRSIQHAGMMLGLAGAVGHLWKGLTPEQASDIPQVMLPSGRMAVTGACLAVRRDLFERASGLDEQAFPVAFNDADFCLRVRELGFRTLYRGDAALVHHESQSRGADDALMERRKRLARETATFIDRWGHLFRDDPYGSPAFDPTLESGAIHPALGQLQSRRE